MRHDLARLAIESILAQMRFDDELAQAIVTTDIQQGHAARVGVDLSPIWDRSPLTAAPAAASMAAPLPETAAGVISQLLPVVLDRPIDPGAQTVSLLALSLIWDSASRDEHLRLRRIWLAQQSSRKDSGLVSLTRNQLRDWQRALPTVHAIDSPTPASLAGMLDAPSAEVAYRDLAAWLGPGTNLTTLTCSLATLAQQTLLNHLDRDGRMLSALAGLVAAERLCALAPPEQLCVLLPMLGHQVWWQHRLIGRRPLVSDRLRREISLASAVRSGDLTASRRAGRIAAQDASCFWALAADLLDECLTLPGGLRRRALSAWTVLLARSPSGLLSPDDAAAFAAQIASVHYLAAHPATT